MGAQAVKPIQSSEPDDLYFKETECLKLVRIHGFIGVIIIQNGAELNHLKSEPSVK
jgi:hypothetical protein